MYTYCTLYIYMCMCVCVCVCMCQPDSDLLHGPRKIFKTQPTTIFSIWNQYRADFSEIWLLYIFICVCVHVRTCVCVYVVYVCMCVCVCVCVCQIVIGCAALALWRTCQASGGGGSRSRGGTDTRRHMRVSRCITLTATHRNMLQHTSTCCNMWRTRSIGICVSRGATHWLQHTAIHCNMLQHAATCCNMWLTRSIGICVSRGATHCNTLNAIHYNTLQHTATHCNTYACLDVQRTTTHWLQHTAMHRNLMHCMQRTALHCNGLQYTSTHCNALQCTAMHCNALQCTAMQCNALQCTAMHCNALLRTATHCNTLQRTATQCNSLQHIATHCNALQRTATHCNTPKHTKVHFTKLHHTGTHWSQKLVFSEAIVCMKVDYTSRQRYIFFERTWNFTRIQFTMRFINFLFVEMNYLVSSDPNIMLKRQTCGQRSSMVGWSKRRALAFYFCVWICSMFAISECRGSQIYVFALFRYLPKKVPLNSGDFRLKNAFSRKFVGSCQCAAAFFLQVPKLRTDVDLTLLYILILETYTKFIWKHKMLSLSVCFLQPCSSAGRRFAASTSRLDYYRPIGSIPQKWIRWNAFKIAFHWESAFVRKIPYLPSGRVWYFLALDCEHSPTIVKFDTIVESDKKLKFDTHLTTLPAHFLLVSSYLFYPTWGSNCAVVLQMLYFGAPGTASPSLGARCALIYLMWLIYVMWFISCDLSHVIYLMWFISCDLSHVIYLLWFIWFILCGPVTWVRDLYWDLVSPQKPSPDACSKEPHCGCAKNRIAHHSALKSSWNLAGVEPGDKDGPGWCAGNNQNAPFFSR